MTHRRHPVPNRVAEGTRSPIQDMDAYRRACADAQADPSGFWLGVTRERVRQIKERALSRLRHPSRHQFLRALTEDV